MPRAMEKLLYVLTFVTPLLAEPQALEFVSASTLRRLVRRKLLVCVPTLIHWPLLPLERPLGIWRPKEPRVDAASVSYQTCKRWRGMGTAVVRLYVATAAAAKRTGGIARDEVRKGLQATHDAHLYQIYRQLPEDIQARWVSEDLLRSHGWPHGETVPDAMITGDKKMFLDMCGQYSPARIRELLALAYHAEVSIALF
jgi:hypothetical protein